MGLNNMMQFIRQMSGKLGSNIYAGVPANNAQQISFLRQLQKEMKEKNELDVPLESLEVVVFDLETTGFYPDKGDSIISIGAVKMIGEQIDMEQTFYSLIHLDTPLSEEISQLTNITDEQLKFAPPASEVFFQFLEFINSRVLVAHHAKHEQVFMQRITWELVKTRFEHRIVDTSYLIQLSCPQLKSSPLEALCLHCGIEIKNRHNALGDAKMTAEIWRFFIKKAKALGFNNLREVYEHIVKLR